MKKILNEENQMAKIFDLEIFNDELLTFLPVVLFYGQQISLPAQFFKITFLLLLYVYSARGGGGGGKKPNQ